LGRDAWFRGNVALSGGVPTQGPFVFQAKFVEGASAAGSKPKPLLMTAVKKECKRIEKRIEEDNWPRACSYVLMTNVDTPRRLREGVIREFEQIMSGSRITVWGGTDLCDLLDNTPDIRVAFPQLLSLRDLNQLLSSVVNKAVLERSLAAVGEAEDLAKVFFPTHPYYDALAALDKHSFVVLTGAPEMGKTTIARMIGLAQLTRDWSYFDCYSPEDFFANLDDNAQQSFVADDAFGTTEYQPNLALPWGMQLPKILRHLNSKRWLIWTSRPAPLSFALQRLHLERKAAGFPHPSEVKVDASTLNVREKAQILYRHVKSAKLADVAKQVVRQFGSLIVRSEHFTPERIRRFVTGRLEAITEGMTDHEAIHDLKEVVMTEIQEPTNRMAKSFRNIDTSHQNFMISLLDADSISIAEASASEAYFRLFRGEADVPPERIAVDLDGHFLRIKSATAQNLSRSKGQSETITRTLEWIHPSWRDICIEYLAERKERRTKFLQRCSINGISLALSQGGGALGERINPLLRHDDDWHNLSKTVCRMAETCATGLLERLSIIILEANPASTESNQQQIKDIAKRFLGVYDSRFRNSSDRVSVRCMATLFNLEKLCEVNYLEHHLKTMFEEYVEYVIDETEQSSEYDVKESLEVLVGLLTLAEQNLPATYSKLCSDERIQEVFIDSVSLFDSYESHSIGLSDDDLEFEACNAEELATLFEEIDHHMSDISDRIQGTISHVRWARAEVDQEISERADRERERQEQEELKEQIRQEEMEAAYYESHPEVKCDSPLGDTGPTSPVPSTSLLEPLENRDQLEDIFEDL
jgi:hypothetical protein